VKPESERGVKISVKLPKGEGTLEEAARDSAFRRASI
jgi:hypothetical protein